MDLLPVSVMGERLKHDEGLGLIEILIAMTVLAVGIFASMAGFSSAFVGVNRAAKISTAGTLADKQMEAYRGLLYNSVLLDTSLGASVDSTYSGDSALAGDSQTGTVNITGSCSSGIPATCTRIQPPVTGPDGRTYRIDTYIVWYCVLSTISGGSTSSPTCTGTTAAPVKKITVVVRDGSAGANNGVLIRESSTFDPTTGS